MGTANAGRISINLSAGTAQFVVDMEKANAKIREMGAAHGHAVSGVQATSAALRTLEGNIGNNLRAAENFIAKTLGLGDALKNIFPVVGAIALAGTFYELIKKAGEFGEALKNAAEAPRRIATEFQALIQPIRLSNAELQVANDKLENQIAKLSGRRENTLKLALHEAAVEAEKLAESLTKDLDGVQKLLEQEQIGSFKAFFTRQQPTEELTEQFKKFRGTLTDIALETSDKLAKTTDPAKQAQIYAEASARRLAAIKGETDELRKQLATAEGIEKVRDTSRARSQFTSTPYGSVVQYQPQANTATGARTITTLKQEIADLNEITAQAGLRSQNTALTRTKERLDAAASNAKLDQPFREYLAELEAKKKGAQAELAAALQSTGKEDFVGGAQAKGYAEAEQAITRLNLRLAETKQKPLSVGQQAEIIGGTTSVALTQARTQARERQLQAEKEIQQGSAQVSDKLDAEELKRQQILATLSEQIAEAQKLYAAEAGGSEAVFQAQERIKLAKIDDPAIRERTATLAQIERNAEIQKTVLGINRETEAIGRQTAAVLGGTAARREAQLATIRASGQSPEIIAAQERAQKAQYQLEDAAQLKGLPATAGIRAYFQELSDSAQSAAMQVKNVLGGAFESLNDTLAKVITGQKADWASFFQGISAELARLAIQNAELAAIRGLGGAATAGGASGNAGSGGSIGGVLGGILGSLGRGGSAASRSAAAGGTPGFISDGDAGSDAADAVSATGGVLSKLGGFFGKLFGGFRASGGDVDPGRAYIVGEKGPELFTPPGGGGSITPNNKLGGNVFYSIDARGANEADVEQRVNRSLVAVHGNAVRNSAAVQAEMQRRKPRGS